MGLGGGEAGLVLLEPGEDAHRRVIVQDHPALRRLRFQRGQHRIGAVAYHLDRVPLRRVGDRHPGECSPFERGQESEAVVH
jgi:hypothetical protein